MTVFRKTTALLLALFLLLPGLIPAHAAQESTTDLVRKLINYFHYYQEDASLEYELILEQIREQALEMGMIPAARATHVTIELEDTVEDQNTP